MKKTVIVITACTLLLGACAHQPSQQQTGQVVGGVLGGVLGSQVGKGKGRTAAIIAGSLVGVLIGGSIGRNMDDTDKLKAQQALEDSRTNQPTAWRNPDSGYNYTVTPTRTYQPTSGSSTVCREYTTEAVISGRKEVVYGEACRQPDGTWQAVSR